MKKFGTVFIFLLTLLSTSCSHAIPDYRHDGIPEKQYQADYTDCVALSGQANLKRSHRPDFVKRCMIGKGYSGDEL